MAFFESPGLRMHYEIFPGLVAHDTLFFHGNLASNRWWQPSLKIWQARASGKKAAGALIMAEWRGCGQTSAPQHIEELQMTNLADDYLGLINSLNLKKVSVVGHSTGCLIALLAMAKAPHIFDRAVLLDPVNHKGVDFPPEGIEAFKMMSQDPTFCHTVMSGTIKGVDVNDPLFQELADDAFHVAPLIWSGIPAALRDLDFSEEMKKITHPILILHGVEDPILPIAGSRELVKVLPNARLLEIPAHGHSLNIEDPKAFVGHVTDFLGL